MLRRKKNDFILFSLILYTYCICLKLKKWQIDFNLKGKNCLIFYILIEKQKLFPSKLVKDQNQTKSPKLEQQIFTKKKRLNSRGITKKFLFVQILSLIFGCNNLFISLIPVLFPP